MQHLKINVDFKIEFVTAIDKTLLAFELRRELKLQNKKCM